MSPSCGSGSRRGSTRRTWSSRRRYREIRHVWVAAGTRGLGVGRRLLTGLEREAAARGFGVVRLGTHRALTEAVQMYRSSGYAEVPPYGQEPHAHYWFEKRQPYPTAPS